MTIFKTKTTRLFIRGWWTWYLYWIPTFYTAYHGKDSCLINFYVEKEDASYTGNEIDLNICIFGLIININYWWNVKCRQKYRGND